MPALPHVMFRASQPMLSGISSHEGGAFARSLATACRSAGFTCSEPDLWRDVGWEFKATQEDDDFAVRFGKRGDQTVLVAVVPWDVLGLLARFRSHKPKRTFPTHVAICSAIHRCLLEDPSVSTVSWMLGGPPESVRQYSTPLELPFREGF